MTESWRGKAIFLNIPILISRLIRSSKALMLLKFGVFLLIVTSTIAPAARFSLSIRKRAAFPPCTV